MVSVAAVLIVAPGYCQWTDAQHRATLNHHLHRSHHHHYQQTGILRLSCTCGSVDLAEISSGLSKDIKEWTHLHWLSLFTWICSRSERPPPPSSADFLWTSSGGVCGDTANWEWRLRRSSCMTQSPMALFEPRWCSVSSALSLESSETPEQSDTLSSHRRPVLGRHCWNIMASSCFLFRGSIWSEKNLRQKKTNRWLKENKTQRLHLCTICQGMWGIYINLYRLHDEIIWNANGVITDFCIIVVIYLHILGGWVFKWWRKYHFSYKQFSWRFPAQ